jgi:hypothetical protein
MRTFLRTDVTLAELTATQPALILNFGPTGVAMQHA